MKKLQFVLDIVACLYTAAYPPHFTPSHKMCGQAEKGVGRTHIYTHGMMDMHMHMHMCMDMCVCTVHCL